MVNGVIELRPMESFPACPFSDSETTDGDSLFPGARGLAANQKNASVDSARHLAGLQGGYRENKHAYVAVFPFPVVSG